MNITDLLEEIGVTQKEVEENRGESMFLSYVIDDQKVDVEINAPNLGESLLGLPVDIQAKLFKAILKHVPEIGDHDRILDEDKKRAGARIIRMRPEGDEIKLLLTR